MILKPWTLPLVFAVCTTPPLYAQTSSAIEAQLSAMEKSLISWEAHTHMQVSGIPIYVKPFSSRLSVAAAAQSLGQKTDMFQRVLVAKGKIVLSGLQPDWHWLAEVQPTLTGSQGYISVLRYDASASHVQAVSSAPHEWLPANARRYFAHSSQIAVPASAMRHQTLNQHVYTVPLSAPRLNTYIGMRLRQGGWTVSQPFAAADHSSEWRRHNARLVLFLREQGGATSLFMQHME